MSPSKGGMSTAALAIRDTTYLLDFFQTDLPTTEDGPEVARHSTPTLNPKTSPSPSPSLNSTVPN